MQRCASATGRREVNKNSRRTRAKTNRYLAKRNATETRLRHALERLVKGMPTHPDLRSRRYRLTVSTLAKEAGTSRNAIYSNHRGMLADIEAAKRRSVTVPETLESADDKITELRAIIRGHESDIRQLATENATLVLRAQTAEERLAECMRKNG